MMKRGRRARFELFQGIAGDWYFRLIGRNGEIVMASEGYASKYNANRAIARVAIISREAWENDIRLVSC